MDLKELRRQRRGAAVGKIMPYAGYIIQSGVAMVFIFILIAFSAWYTSLLRNIPEGVPIRWIMLVLLLPAAVSSSFRAYLQRPDTIFLLPQGHRMRDYFAPAWVSGNVWKILRLAFVLVTLWPLYIRTDAAPKLLWATALLLIGVKLLSSFGYWRELGMLSRPASRAFTLLRWAAGGLMIAAWLWQPSGRALIFIALLAAAYAAALAVPGRHGVAWERLIAAEENQSARALMILGWFVDIPGREQRVNPRRYLAKWGRGLPWRRDTAYRFLLTKSFARGDIFGILIRITVLGLVLCTWYDSTFAGTCIYLFFMFILGVQLSALRKLHSESFWLTVYPLPPGSKGNNTIQFIFRVHLVLAFLLWVPFLIEIAVDPIPSLGTFLGGIVLAYLFKANATRKEARLEEDDL